MNGTKYLLFKVQSVLGKCKPIVGPEIYYFLMYVYNQKFINPRSQALNLYIYFRMVLSQEFLY